MQWQPEIPTTKSSHLSLLRHQVRLIRVTAKDFCQVLGFLSCNIQVENQPNRSRAWLRLQRIRETLGGRETWRSLSVCSKQDYVQHLIRSAMVWAPQVSTTSKDGDYPTFLSTLSSAAQSPVKKLFLMLCLNIPPTWRNNT